MITPAQLDVTAYREQEFSWTVRINGFTFAPADLSLEVRSNTADAAALLTANVGVATGDTGGVPWTDATFTIPRANIDALSAASPLGSNVSLLYAIKVQSKLWLLGGFNLKGSANHG